MTQSQDKTRKDLNLHAPWLFGKTPQGSVDRVFHVDWNDLFDSIVQNINYGNPYHGIYIDTM